MVLKKRILPLCLPCCILASVALAEKPDWGDVKPLPIPPKLQGLWARGRHCDDPRRQLRVTRLTMQYGTNKPVRSYYLHPNDFIHDGAIVPDIDRPIPNTTSTALTYAEGPDFLFDYGNDADPEQLYYRCPARTPRGR